MPFPVSIKRLSVAISAALTCAGAANAFEVQSASIAPGGTFAAAQYYEGFGCTGGNLSPALAWRDAPAGTRSFAVTVYDPDARTGSGWWHWMIVNLPATTQSLPEGAGRIDTKALPPGAFQIRNDYGAAAYGGPCPPAGSAPHHYVFTVYALKTAQLELPRDASPALAGFMIHANAIGSAQMTVRYGR